MTEPKRPRIADDLRNGRASLFERLSTAESVAGILRTQIMEGVFPPGSRLPEEAIASALGVSRNTVREAFRLLCHESLAVHELNRGVSVAVPTAADVMDLYRVRRTIEAAAARMVSVAEAEAVKAVREAVEAGRRAAKGRQWAAVGTADLAFHAAIVTLAGSSRLDEMMRRILAELRLVFHVMADPERFHAPYLNRNDQIAALLERGDGDAAAAELLVYLNDAEAQLLQAYAEGADRTLSQPSDGPTGKRRSARPHPSTSRRTATRR